MHGRVLCRTSTPPLLQALAIDGSLCNDSDPAHAHVATQAVGAYQSRGASGAWDKRGARPRKQTPMPNQSAKKAT